MRKEAPKSSSSKESQRPDEKEKSEEGFLVRREANRIEGTERGKDGRRVERAGEGGAPGGRGAVMFSPASPSAQGSTDREGKERQYGSRL